MKTTHEGASSPSGFRQRIVVFLVLLMIITFSGLLLMKTAQESLDNTSKRFRTLLLPTAKLLQAAKSELDLQIQELSLISAFELKSQDSGGKVTTLSPHQQTLLRISPSIQSLLQFKTTPIFPATLSEPFKPWTEAVTRYQEQVGSFRTFQDAITQLEEIREQTSLLEKNLDREFSVQLLKLDQENRSYLAYWTLLVLGAFLISAAFGFLFWRWIRPLGILRHALQSTRNNEEIPLAPTSFKGEGLRAPPREIQELAESVRHHLLNFLEQRRELWRREEKIQDSERATTTLLSALFHLTRHNEELLQKVIKNEKLATMSEMGAQLAHEIRNPLNSMNLKLELLREDLNGEQKEIIDRILREIDRLDALTESHLSGTRASLGFEPENLCHLQSVVDECLDLFSDEIKLSSITIKKFLGADNIILKLPRNVVKSALINLLKNSLEALDQAPVRMIQICLEKTGPHWTLQVLDTGPGLPQAVKEGRFESFVTFKKQGSGLGLATAKKMLEAYGIQLKIFTPKAPYTTSIGFTGPLSAIDRPVISTAGEIFHES
jgi:two-component system sensor histidine kinase HydH